MSCCLAQGVGKCFKRLHHNSSTLALQQKGSPDNMDTFKHDWVQFQSNFSPRGWAGWADLAATAMTPSSPQTKQSNDSSHFKARKLNWLPEPSWTEAKRWVIKKESSSEKRWCHLVGKTNYVWTKNVLLIFYQTTGNDKIKQDEKTARATYGPYFQSAWPFLRARGLASAVQASQQKIPPVTL